MYADAVFCSRVEGFLWNDFIYLEKYMQLRTSNINPKEAETHPR